MTVARSESREGEQQRSDQISAQSPEVAVCFQGDPEISEKELLLRQGGDEKRRGCEARHADCPRQSGPGGNMGNFTG